MNPFDRQCHDMFRLVASGYKVMEDPNLPLVRIDEDGNEVPVLFWMVDGVLYFNPIRLEQVKSDLRDIATREGQVP